MIDISALRAAIELLYTDRMDITSVQTVVVNGITKTKLPTTPQITDVPCHIGWPTGTQDATNGTHTLEQNQIVVSCAPEVVVPTGSRIDIRRYDSAGRLYAELHGTTAKASITTGAASVGANHQELPVTLEAVA